MGRLTGNAGVCLSTLGPGATNLLTGVADANLDKAPLVAITGQGGLERLHKESHPPLDVVDTFEPVTKWNAQISDPAIVHEAVLSTFDLVATGTTGERIAEETGLAVERKESGLIGGDTQIGAEVVEGRVDGVVFLRDPLTAQPQNRTSPPCSDCVTFTTRRWRRPVAPRRIYLTASPPTRTSKSRNDPWPSQTPG